MPFTAVGKLLAKLKDSFLVQQCQAQGVVFCPQGMPRGEFLEAVSDVSIRQYFTQLYAVGLSVYFYLCVHLLTNLNQCKLSANTA